MADRSAWDAQLGTGLRTEYDFTIHMASFGTDAAYNDGQTYLLILNGVDEEGQDASEMLSLGDGWESTDGGLTAHHDKKALINRNSVYGKWIGFAADALEEANNTTFFDKSVLSAETWIDTKWHLEERVIGEAFTARDGKEVAARSRLVPVGYLGTTSEAPVASAKPSVADRRAALAAKASQAAPAPSTNGSGSIDTQLIDLAKANDFNSFVNAALSIDSVVTDEKLAESIIDSGPSGFYAVNH